MVSAVKKIVLLILVILLGAVAWICLRTPSTPFESQAPASAETALIKQGEYVAIASDCVACHTTPEGKPFAGGLEMATPIGSIYTTNITPDSETGIGTYTLADFDRAVRKGYTPDGKHLYPAMPYVSYSKLTDDDVKALFAYFMKGVEPVTQANKPTDIEWPLNARWPLALWEFAFNPGKVYQPNPEKSDVWNRGAYLVEGPGHCGSCHTPRGIAMQETGLTADDSEYMSGAVLDGWYAPNLRGDGNTAVGHWSEAELAQFLATGRNAHSVVFGSMTEAFNNSTQYLSEEDLNAMAVYMKSLKTDANVINPNADRSVEANNPQGKHVYAQNCAACHGTNGEGKAPWISPLTGVTSLNAPAESAINITLNGSMRVAYQGTADPYRMPPHRAKLSDEQIAAVLTYVRGSWGNQGDAVSAEQVAELKKDTDPANPEMIILQMR
jgi:mono/diheme cytochrome c family protein